MGQTERDIIFTGDFGPWHTEELDDLVARHKRIVQAQHIDPWRRGYEPLESQCKFHESTAKFKGFSGPVGSGKSLALAGEAIRLAYVNPGRWGLIGAPTFPMLRDTTQRAFFDALEIAEIPYSWAKTENTVTLTEVGSKVLFRSLQEFERLRGTNLAWFGIDELTYSPEESWTRLEGRLRDPKAKQRAGFAVWTPNGFDWVYDKFIGPSKVDGYEAVIAKPRENVHLPSDYYDNLAKSYGELFYKQEAGGEYLNLCAGQVYYAFNRAESVKPVEFNPRLPLCWSLDFNVDPMCSTISQRDGETVNVLDEIVLANSNTPAACVVFLERLKPYLAKLREGVRGVVPIQVRVYGDPAGNQRQHSDTTDWLMVKNAIQRDPSIKIDWFVDRSNPSVKSRVNAVNARLLNANGKRNFFVHPRCKELIADFEQVIWLVDSRGVATGDIDKRNKKRTHISDAVGYKVLSEFPLEGYSTYRASYLGA